MLLWPACSGGDRISQASEESDGHAADATGGACHEHVSTRARCQSMIFERLHTQHRRKARGPDGHRVQRAERIGDLYQPPALDARALREPTPMLLAHAPSGQYDAIAGREIGRLRLRDGAGEINARHHWIAPDNLVFAEYGEAILIVQPGVFDRDKHVTRRQSILLERFDIGMDLPITLGEQQRLEGIWHICPLSCWCIHSRGLSGPPASRPSEPHSPQHDASVCDLYHGPDSERSMRYTRRHSRSIYDAKDELPPQM